MSTSDVNNVVTPYEASLKLELLRTQIAQAKLDLAQKTRNDKNQAKVARLDLRQKRAIAAKAEFDLAAAKLASAREHAIDSENAEYMMYNEVTEDTMKAAILELNKLSRRFPGKPLVITLNSPGGSVIDGLALYDHIQELRRRGHHVTVKVRGMAASMGGILLQSGDKRVIGPEAVVLIHEVASGARGKVNEMQDRVDFSKLLWKKCATILAARSTMTVEEIQEKAFKFDWWLESAEALELGFADEIG